MRAHPQVMSGVAQRRFAIALAALASLVSSPHAVAGAGDPDPTFGAKGRVVQDFGGPSYAADVLLQPNGKIVVFRNAKRAGVDPVRDNTVVISRFRRGGRLDRSFGTRGHATLETPGDDYGGGLARQPNGRILIGFTNDRRGQPDSFAVARLRRDGTPDPAFSGDGVRTASFGAGFEAADGVDIALAGPRRIVVGGEVEVVRDQFGDYDFAVMRFASDGELDGTFSKDGRQTVDFGHGGDDHLAAIATDSLGRVVLVGSADSPGGGDDQLALARYGTDGELDGTFSGDGLVLGDAGQSASDVAITLDDRIVTAGKLRGDFLIGRFATDGAPDPAFAGDGFQTVDFAGGPDAAGAVALDGERVVVAGEARRPGRRPNFGIARLRSNGGLDRGFDGGREMVDFNRARDFALGVAVDRRRNVVAAGRAAQGGANTGLVRLAG